MIGTREGCGGDPGEPFVGGGQAGILVTDRRAMALALPAIPLALGAPAIALALGAPKIRLALGAP